MKTKEQKAQIIESLGKLFDECTSLAVSNYKGLSMKDLNELRDKIRPRGASFRIVKNTLARIAAKGTSYEDMLAGLEGPNALIFMKEDVSAVLKALFVYSKNRKTFSLLRGQIDGVPLDGAGLKTYSELPTTDEVRSMFVGVLGAPLANVVSVFDAPARTIVGVVSAYEEKLGGRQAA